MKRSIFLTLVLVTLIFKANASGKPVKFVPPAVTNYILSINEDFFVSNTDGGEWVHFTGHLHILSRFIPTDPIFPNDPLRLNINPQNIQGVGATTGLTYHVIGSYSTAFNTIAGSTNSLVFSLHLLPPNPIRLLSQAATYSLEFTLDNDGYLINADALMIATEF